MDTRALLETSQTWCAKTIIAIPADTHCGSPVGLITPGNWKLVNGGEYIPNLVQELIIKQWDECWQEVNSLVGTDGRVIIVSAGDATEGIHHGSAQLVSSRQDEHQRIHVACMRRAMDMVGFDSQRGDLLVYVSGTPAHVRSGAENEEAIARQLGAVPFLQGTKEQNYQDGCYTWPMLRMNINGVLFDIAHQGPVAGLRPWLRGNSLMAMLRGIYLDCLEYGVAIPRYYIRAHRHLWVMPMLYRGEHGTIEGMLTPCFQAKSEYAYRVANQEIVSNIGMLMFIVNKNGDSTWECKRVRVAQEQIQTW